MAKKRVLIVEDMFLNSEFLRIWVSALGYDVCGVARSADQACDLATSLKPDIILMDLQLDGARDGVDAALDITKTQDPTVIYVTGLENPVSQTRMSMGRPFRILVKPIEPTELMDALHAAESRGRLGCPDGYSQNVAHV